MIAEKAMKHNIKLSTHIDGIPETITADERKLKQILYNLLSNAVKFTPNGGKVNLEARMVDCVIREGRRRIPKGYKLLRSWLKESMFIIENPGNAYKFPFLIQELG